MLDPSIKQLATSKNFGTFCVTLPNGQIASHVMWVDADVTWLPNAIPRLLSHDLDVVAGLYPVKEPPDNRLAVVALTYPRDIGDRRRPSPPSGCSPPQGRCPRCR